MRCGVVRDVRLWMMCRCPPWWRAGPCWAPAGRSQDSSCHSSWSVPASLTPGDSPHTTYIHCIRGTKRTCNTFYHGSMVLLNTSWSCNAELLCHQWTQSGQCNTSVSVLQSPTKGYKKSFVPVEQHKKLDDDPTHTYIEDQQLELYGHSCHPLDPYLTLKLDQRNKELWHGPRLLGPTLWLWPLPLPAPVFLRLFTLPYYHRWSSVGQQQRCEHSPWWM